MAATAALSDGPGGSGPQRYLVFGTSVAVAVLALEQPVDGVAVEAEPSGRRTRVLDESARGPADDGGTGDLEDAGDLGRGQQPRLVAHAVKTAVTVRPWALPYQPQLVA